MAIRAPADQDLAALCGDPTFNGKSSVLQRMPYLQSTNSNGTSVMWSTVGTPVQFVSVTTPEGDPVAHVEATLDGMESLKGRMLASIKGLAPATVYCYAIEDGAGKELYGRVGFRTAPDKEGPTKFVVLGDTGDGSEDQLALAAQIDTVPFDFMLHVGDIAYSTGTTAEFDTNYFDVYGELLQHFAMFPVPGNHEYRSGDAAAYRALFDLPNNERWYSFDWGTVHFVALDTEQLGSKQSQWLEHDLKSNRSTWTVAYLHKAPFSSGWHGSDDDVRETFAPVFAKYDVDVVFSGHDHHYERTSPQDGVVYFVTGGGGAGTYPVENSDFTAFAEEVVEMLYVVADDQSFAVHAIDASGKEFDQLLLER